MSVDTMLQWLQQTWWATTLRQSSLLFPVVEGSHILALSFSIGLIMVFDLRLLRIAFRGEAVSRIMNQMMPWTIAGFGALFVTGVSLFMSHAQDAFNNTFFRVKMLLIVLAGLNALFYQIKYYPKMTEWDNAPSVPVGAKVCAVLSLILWFGVIACGRTMAYEI